MTLLCCRRATGDPRTDQADPNANIYTKHGPYINKLTVYMPTLIFWFRCKKFIDRPLLQNWMKIVGYQIFLRITRFAILVISPDYQKFCLRSTLLYSMPFPDPSLFLDENLFLPHTKPLPISRANRKQCRLCTRKIRYCNAVLSSQKFICCLNNRNHSFCWHTGK